LTDGSMTVQNYSFSLPSGWSVNYQTCKRVGKTVYLSGMFMNSTGQTVKSFNFSNVIPADISCPARIAFSGFDNATDASLHGIVQGRTITFYRPETTSLKDIEFSVVYSLI